ncbi:MAG: SIR2 family protein [Bacteroidota bacterium]
MSQHPSQLPLKETLQNHIQSELEDLLDPEDLKRIEYYSEDGFFFLEDNYRLDVVECVLKFFESQEPGDLYHKLAQLPFHMILSLSPDRLLSQAFDQQGLPHHFHFYDKKNYNATQDNEILNFKPSQENRLIYNLFGSIDNEDSLILSYDDLFEFLQRIFNNYKLPQTVEETIFEANYYVFIGFNYSKWYLKLLLRLMKMHEEVKKVFGMDEPSRAEHETFFVNEFNMNFTRLDTIDFINTLHSKCQEEGMLLSKNATTKNKLPIEMYNKAKTQITQGDIEGAFETLTALNQKNKTSNDFSNRLVLLQARYQKHKADLGRGILSNEQSTLGHNRILNDLLALTNEYKP